MGGQHALAHLDGLVDRGALLVGDDLGIGQAGEQRLLEALAPLDADLDELAVEDGDVGVGDALALEVVGGGLAEKAAELVGVAQDVGGDVLAGRLVVDAGVVADDGDAALVGQPHRRDGGGRRDRGEHEGVDPGRGRDVHERALLGRVALGVQLQQLEPAPLLLGVVAQPLAHPGVVALRVHVDDADAPVLTEPAPGAPREGDQAQHRRRGGEGTGAEAGAAAGAVTPGRALRPSRHGGPPWGTGTRLTWEDAVLTG